MSPVYLVAGAMFCKCSTVDIDISAGWLVGLCWYEVWGVRYYGQFCLVDNLLVLCSVCRDRRCAVYSDL